MKRWPLIRHVRWAWHAWHVYWWYAIWAELGYVPLNAKHDYDILDAIWRGEI